MNSPDRDPAYLKGDSDMTQHLLRRLIAALFCGLAVCTNSVAADQRPNIIWIMTDDLGYGDLGCFGQTRIQTPSIDRLSAEGMRLTDFYAGCTVCRPSRLVLWTGQHTGHTAISSNAGYVFKPSDVTVMELLQQAGYATGGVGKWAMGSPGSGGEPTRNGFDFWFGYADQGAAHNYYPTHLHRFEGEQVERVALPGNVLMEHPNARGLVADPKHRVTYAHDKITEEALGFVRRNQARPFLLHVHWNIPHANNEGGRVTGDGMETPDYGPYADEAWPSQEKGHAAMITRMDGDVGRLIALLRELKLDRKTLVLFTSDNGAHAEGGHGVGYFQSSGPLRGRKRDLYEGGIRVPTIAWQPGAIEPGATSAEPLAFCDFLPTACELIGVEPPEHVDGVSFAPTLYGNPDAQARREHLYWKYGGKEAVRMGKWKGFRASPKRPVELYDLERDLGEKTDVAADNPEVVRKIEAAMQQATADE